MKNCRSKALTVFILVTVLTLVVLSVFIADRTSGVFAYAYELEYTPGYGYDSMTDDMKRVYDDMVEDIETMLTLGTDVTTEKTEYNGISYRPLGFKYMCADYSGISVSDIKAVYSSLQMLHPEYYFLPNMMLVYSDHVTDEENGIELVIIDDYATEDARNAVDNTIERMMGDILSDVPDDVPASEAVRIIYGRIQSYMTYAYDSVGAPSNEHWAHSIIGALPDHSSAVCEGISKWFSYLMLEEGIENYVVTGNSGSGIGDPSSANHAWNVVKLEDGKWYDFDLTWDNNYEDQTNLISYQYFAMASSDFDNDHYRKRTVYDEIYLYEVPEAQDDYSFNIYASDTAGKILTDRNTFIQVYTELWKKTLDRGDRYMIIFVQNSANASTVRSYARNNSVLSEVQKNLASAGYPDLISCTGTYGTYNAKYICLAVSSSMYCTVGPRHSYTVELPTSANLASSSTCVARARYYYVCEYCGERGDNTYEYGDYSNAHKLSSTKAKSPTCTADGNTEYWYCSLCKKYFDSKDATDPIKLEDTVIKALGHSYEYHERDEDTHLIECVRGDSQIVEEHDFEFIGSASDGKYTTVTYKCTLCGYTKEEKTDNCANGHTYDYRQNDAGTHLKYCVNGDYRINEEHDLKLTGTATDGRYTTLTYKCQLCGYSTEEKTDNCVNGHTYEVWHAGENGHYSICEVCGETGGEFAHEYETADKDGENVTYRCTVCGYSYTGMIVPEDTTTVTTGDGEGDDPATEPPHIHVYGEWQQKDDDSHIRYCECGESVTEAHSMIVTDAVTEGSERIVTYRCTACGYTSTVTQKIENRDSNRILLIAGLVLSIVLTAGAVIGLVVALNRRRKQNSD